MRENYREIPIKTSTATGWLLTSAERNTPFAQRLHDRLAHLSVDLTMSTRFSAHVAIAPSLLLSLSSIFSTRSHMTSRQFAIELPDDGGSIMLMTAANGRSTNRAPGTQAASDHSNRDTYWNPATQRMPANNSFRFAADADQLA
jgi:hypothetical protein